MGRKEIYSFLEGVEGGASILADVKAEFTSVDGEAKANREKAEGLQIQLDNAKEELMVATEKAGQVDGLQQGKTEVEQRLEKIEKLLEEKEKEASDLAAEKLDRDVKDHFRNKTSNFFKGKMEDVITLASARNGFSADGDLFKYGNLSGDEAIEALKVDYKDYGVGETGTSTVGGISTTETKPKQHEKAHDGFVAALSKN